MYRAEFVGEFLDLGRGEAGQAGQVGELVGVRLPGGWVAEHGGGAVVSVGALQWQSDEVAEAIGAFRFGG
jgi:hypothetical protein